MTSEKSKAAGLSKVFPVLEKIFLCTIVIGIVLALSDIDFLVLRISLFGLAAVFFLLAYRPPEKEVPREDNEQLGFSGLLALVIIPKILWICSAVSLVGIALYFSGGTGYKEMLMIGVFTISTGLVLLLIFTLSGVKYLKLFVFPVLLRAIPVFLAGLYFFLK